MRRRGIILVILHVTNPRRRRSRAVGIIIASFIAPFFSLEVLGGLLPARFELDRRFVHLGLVRRLGSCTRM